MQKDNIKFIRKFLVLCFGIIGFFCQRPTSVSAAARIGIEMNKQYTNIISNVLIQNMEHLEKLADVEFLWRESVLGNSAEISVYFTEDMIDCGVDGLLLSPASDQVLPAICRLCEENQIYWGLFFKEIQDQKVKEQCEASPYYIGNTYESEAQNARMLADTALRKGYRNFALISEPRWNDNTSLREQSLYEALQEYPDAKILTEVREMRGLSDVKENVDAILEAYPELDCIYLAGSRTINSANQIIQSIQEHHREDEVHLVTMDFSELPSEDFRSGVLAASYGLPQLFIDPYYLAIKLINTLHGTPLEETETTHCVSGVLVSSEEELQQILPVIENEKLLYFSDEFVETQLFRWNNPELNALRLQEIIDENRLLELAAEEEP